MNMSVVMISAGVEQWDKLTVPAVESLKRHKREDFQLIVMDNGGLDRGTVNTKTMLPYASAVNVAARLAKSDWLVILNNDITIRGDWQPWIFSHYYCGPKLLKVEGTDYIEGWFISIHRDLWTMLNGFNEAFKNSWEDVDLAWRLCRLGIQPKRINTPVHHIWGATRHAIEGSNRWDDENRKLFLANKRKQNSFLRWRKLNA